MSTSQLSELIDAETYSRTVAQDLSRQCNCYWYVYSLVAVPAAFIHSETHPYELPGHGRVWIATYKDGFDITK